MILRCPRCLYRGAVLADGYGDQTCLQCGFTLVPPHELAILAEIKDSINGSLRQTRDLTRRKTGARLKGEA